MAIKTDATAELAAVIEVARRRSMGQCDRHRPVLWRTRDTCFLAPVTDGETNPAAHGNISRHEECACGARRTTNINGPHFEQGRWH